MPNRPRDLAHAKRNWVTQVGTRSYVPRSALKACVAALRSELNASLIAPSKAIIHLFRWNSGVP
jgi:hypothetical protein